MRSWKFWLGVVISIIFLVWALQGLDWSEFIVALREANYWWIIPGVGVYFLAVLIRTWRWHYMLAPIKRIPTLRLFPVVTIGYMGNNVYPARAGEVLRSYVLRRRDGVPISSSLPTVILERLFDGLVMLLFVAVTLPFAPLPAIYHTIVIGFSVLFGVALLVFFGVATQPRLMTRLYQMLVERWLPPRWRERVGTIFEQVLAGFYSLRSPKDTAIIFVASALVWLTETGKYWFVMHAFNFEVSFLVLMLMTAVVNLFTTIPSAPGHVGTFHAPGIAVLVNFGVPQAIATSYTVVLHIALWLPVTALGAFYMLRESVSWREAEQAAQAAEESSLVEPVPVPPEATTNPAVARDSSEHDVERDDIATGVSS